MNKAVIYARYSSRQQRDVSIDDQLKICRAYCEGHGFTVIHEYIDRAMSGTTDKRPAFQEMIAKAGEAQFVVVYKFDRFSRNQYDAPIYKQQLAEKGCRLLSVTEPIPDGPSGLFMDKMMEAQAAYYSMNLSENVKRGMYGNCERGMTNGVNVFGYQTAKDGTYEINEEEAELVREAYKRYIKGETCHAIAKNFAMRGVTTPAGKPIVYSFMNKVLHDRRYIGEYRWGDFVKADGMPRILSDKEFYTAQEVIPIKQIQNESFADYWLSGKLFCGKCNKRMHGQRATGRGGTKYYYYACPKSGDCKCRYARDDVDTTVAQAVIEYLTPDVAKRLAHDIVEAERSENPRQELIEMRRQKKAKKREIDNVVKAIKNGAGCEELYEELKVLKTDLETIESRCGILAVEDAELNEEEIAEFLAYGFSTVDPATILECFCSTVRVKDDLVVITLSIGDENDPKTYAELETSLVRANSSWLANIVEGRTNSGMIVIPGTIVICARLAA